MNARCAPLVSVLAVLVLFLPAPSTAAQPAHPQPAYSTAATCIVTSKNDSGPDTLRDCLSKAVSGDTITFDPAVFPPATPSTISLTSQLPGINQGNITIDGSNAGVVLDGSGIGDPQADGVILASSNNVIRGPAVPNMKKVRDWAACGMVCATHHRQGVCTSARHCRSIICWASCVSGLTACQSIGAGATSSTPSGMPG